MFFGTSEQTGWESVETYYKKASYGKLNMECVVLDEWFTPSHDVNYYLNYKHHVEYQKIIVLFH